MLGGPGQADAAAASNSGTDHSPTPPGVIAGIAVGGAVIIGVLLMAVWDLRRKLRHEERSASVWAASTEQNGTNYGDARSGGSGADAGTAWGYGQGYRSSRDMTPQGPLRVMNPSQSRTVSLGSRVSSLLGFGAANVHASSDGHGTPQAGTGGGHAAPSSAAMSKRGGAGGSDDYGWEYERDRSFDPFDDMSEINGPSAYVQRVHTPSNYAQQQYERYGEKGNSVYSGYASEEGSRVGRNESVRR
jgi:hypothetical protein